MSSSQHKKHQNPESQPVNKPVELSPAFIAIESFEELQLLNLQAIINQLAMQIQKGFKANENGEQTPPLALLRVYAQYLNLYMKLKDKCIKSETKKQATPQPEPKTSVNTSVKTSVTKTNEPVQQLEPQLAQPLSAGSETPDQPQTAIEPARGYSIINRLPHDSITNSQLKKAINGT